MTPAVLDRPASDQCELGGGGTLEELLNSALSEARVNGSTECPVCHARVISTRAHEARCDCCGSRLS
jgi:DnaJ-class molecular chaperone